MTAGTGAALIRCGAGHTTRLDGPDAAERQWAAFGYCKCHCGRPVRYTAVVGRVTDTPCDGRCTSAVGPACSCSCGGRNHGADYSR